MNLKLNNMKTGFTLVELMVFFIFVSLLLAASTPLITKRVRDLPIRKNHGRFVCYRLDNGSYVQQYYNSSKMVSESTGESCTFKPPSNAALYRVVLIGAGAGGYQYYNVENGLPSSWSNIDCTVDNNFCADSSGSGSGSDSSGSSDSDSGSGSGFGIDNLYKLSNEQIKEQLNGTSIRITQWTGKGGNGGDLYWKYLPPADLYSANVYTGSRKSGNAQCGDNLKNGNGDVVRSVYIGGTSYSLACQDVSVREQQMRQRAAQDPDLKSTDEAPRTYIESAHKTRLNGLLKDYALCLNGSSLAEDSLQIKPWIAEQEGPTKSGGNGGSGAYLYYDLTLNLNNIAADSAVDYVKNITKSLVAGSCKTTSCADFTKTIPADGSDGEDYKSWERSNLIIAPVTFPVVSSELYENHKGRDVERYAAIKLPDGSYVVNTNKPTGGEGASYHIAGNGLITFPAPAAGKSAEELAASGSGGTAYTNGGSPWATSDYHDAGLVNSSSSSSSSSSNSSGTNTPVIKYSSQIAQITHRYGSAGGSGSTKTIYASKISNCEIHVGLGGAVINSSTSTIPSLENTTLSCNNGQISESVSAGSYYKSATADTTFSTSVNSGKAVLKKYITEQPLANELVYNLSSKVFTKYPNNEYGRGGAGVGITNSCTAPWGKIYVLTSDHNGNKTSSSISRNYAKPDCLSSSYQTLDDYLEIKNAEPGESGAVIISW